MTKLVVHILFSLTLNGTASAGFPSWGTCASWALALKNRIQITRQNWSPSYQARLTKNTLSAQQKVEFDAWLKKVRPPKKYK